MMITLSRADFHKLSPSCRAEILKLMMNEDEGLVEGFFNQTSVADTAAEMEEEVAEEKKVVNLSLAEAGDLLSNISDRSRRTLKLFAFGQPVPLDALVGEDRPYKDYVELKRSFVGAVNRRLRTVSGNRSAALFSSDRDKTRIKVTPKTSRSLRNLFEMPEPLPNLDFCDHEGRDIDPKNPKCQKLKKKLSEIWGLIDSTSLQENSVEFISATFTHFVANGLDLFVRTPSNWDDEANSPTYEIHSVVDPSIVIENWKSGQSSGELFVGLSGNSSVLAQPVI